MIVYAVTNQVDGGVYVGATRCSLATRKAQHKSRAVLTSKDVRHTPLYEAIRRHGWSSFKWRILEHCPNMAALYEAEMRWIAHYRQDASGPLYNLTDGGLGTIGFEPPPELRAKWSDARRGKPRSPESVAKCAAALRGRKVPEHVVAKLRGRVVSAETREKLRQAKIGRKLTWSEQARENVAEAARRRSAEGKGAKLHPSLAPEVLARRESGEPFASIAQDYGVTPSAVFYFCKRQAA